MPNSVSATLRDRIMRSSSPEHPVVLLEVSHPQLASTVRLVNDTVNLVHGGNTYTAIRFRFVWPDDQEQQAPRAVIEVDNVGKELNSWIEVSNGGSEAVVVLKKVLPSTPNTVEAQITMGLQNIEQKMGVTRFNLSFPDIFFKPLVRMTYRPETHPGLF